MESVFQSRLRKLREEKRMKQVVLSELCGLSPNAVGKYERGEAAPSVEALISIADFFEVSIDYLTGRVDLKKNI